MTELLKISSNVISLANAFVAKNHLNNNQIYLGGTFIL